MNITIYPGTLRGHTRAIPSKSQAHRLLICAAFSDRQTTIFCPETNRDIEATADCLRALGADIARAHGNYIVSPVTTSPKVTDLYCAESGSTLRFLLPIAGALGIDTTFHMEGRLPKRPLSPLWEEMERMGCVLSRPTDTTIRCTGQLKPGSYSIDGSVSSQFISGLLFALALISGNSTLAITGNIESKPYITMTQQAIAAFRTDTRNIAPFHSPGNVQVEGDWSNAAFFLTANALGSNITIDGLDPNSAQGDRAVTTYLKQLEQETSISAANIPDLVPILAIAAGAKQGALFTDIARLRLKESDRVASVASMLSSLGVGATPDENTLRVSHGIYKSCTIDAAGDHRIAMAAAIAATVATGPVTILGAECVSKSYPSFWEEFKKLGGQYEQHIR